MDFKNLFKNTHAVSPVIGVILMVAITVILAAAIGSSVFGQGPAESAPQANLDIKSAGITGSGTTAAIASVKFEHLGGDPIHFEDIKITKVTASLEDGPSYTIGAANNAYNDATNPGLGVFDVGSVKTLRLTTTAGVNAFTGFEPKSGNTVHIKVIDVQTNQLICDKDIRL
ncbi:MAG: type IV pilin N-terminal domain-containing protein [Methanosarcina sp.]